MQLGTLSPISARELVHLLILRELAEVRDDASVTVKGGVNLRLFFGSVRYSEDMDLDGTAQASAAVRNTLKGMFENREFTQRLQTFGIRGLDPGEARTRIQKRRFATNSA